jgi:hypothetical protein
LQAGLFYAFYLLFIIVMTPEQLNKIADLIAKSLED